MAPLASWVGTPLAMLAYAVPVIANSSVLPEYLTYRDLQAKPIASEEGCKCAMSNGLEGLVRKINGQLCLPDPGLAEGLSYANASVCYLPDYGVGQCRMWDAGHVACATDKPEPWCFHFWCYVDPLDCNTGDVSSSVFFAKASGKRYFSYMTCGVPIEDNPYFNLWIPTHLVALAIMIGILVPLAAFLIGRGVCKYYPLVTPMGLPWMLLWITVSIERIIALLGFSTRIPSFPSNAITDEVFEAITLLFFILFLTRGLDIVDESLRELRYERASEFSTSKAMQILESVLLFKTLNVAGWADMTMDLWLSFYGISKVTLWMIWVLNVMKFPTLSTLLTGGFVSTFFLIGFGSLFTFKESLSATLLLAYERPFKVADIISLHTCSNNDNVMSAIAVGFVEKLGVIHIGIRNFDMRLQYVPTHEFAKGTIKNWSAREYRPSIWRLWLSMRTSTEAVKAFRDGADKILQSHPSCKTDGYVKVCQKTLRDGGYEVEVICFTKPHADHHTFKMDMSTAFSKLASRLGIEFVWNGITREGRQANTDSGFQYSGQGADGKADVEVRDLLFEGRFTRGNLIGKFKKWHDMKLAKGFKQDVVDASLSYDLMFELPLKHPAVVADAALNWTEDHKMLKGELTVMVGSGSLKALLPSGMFGGNVKELFVVAIVTKKSAGAGAENGVSVDSDAGGMKLGNELNALHCAGEEVVACCKTMPRRLTKNGEATWGETLHLGEVPLERAGSAVLRLMVGHLQSSGAVQLLGTAEKPLLELVMTGWQDQRVKVEGLSLKAAAANNHSETMTW